MSRSILHILGYVWVWYILQVSTVICHIQIHFECYVAHACKRSIPGRFAFWYMSNTSHKIYLLLSAVERSSARMHILAATLQTNIALCACVRNTRSSRLCRLCCRRVVVCVCLHAGACSSEWSARNARGAVHIYIYSICVAAAVHERKKTRVCCARACDGFYDRCRRHRRRRRRWFAFACVLPVYNVYNLKQ